MRIAVLGLGLIGRIWARHWRADGHDVRGWNRTPRPELPGTVVDIPTAVRDADVVAIVVSDGPAAHEVLTAALPYLGPGSTVCLHSTVGVDECRQLAALARSIGAAFVDMPFTGSSPGAENRASVFFCGDDGGDVERIRAIYQAQDGRGVAKVLLPMGRVGQAMATKLALNLALAGIWQATAEAITLAERSGVAPADFYSALEFTAARSVLADMKKAKVLAGDATPQFATGLMRKDLHLAQALARELALPLPLLAGLAEAYTRAGARGEDARDYATALLGGLRMP